MPSRVLVVDDSRTVQTAVAWSFLATPFEAVAAHTEAEARSLAQELTPDLVLIDVHLENTDVYDLAEGLRASSVPPPTVVLLTTPSSPADAERLAASGIDGRLDKPFETKALIHLAETVAERRRAQADTEPPPSDGSSPPDTAASEEPECVRVAESEAPAPDAQPPSGPLFGAPTHERAPEADLWSMEVAPPSPVDPVSARPSGPPRPAPAEGSLRPEIQAEFPGGLEDLEGLEDLDHLDDPWAATQPGGPLAGPTLEPPTPPHESGDRPDIDMWSLDDADLTGADLPPALAAPDVPSAEPPRDVVQRAVSEVARRSEPALASIAVERREVLEMARDAVERIAWEVVPDLAEAIIREEIQRLLREEREARSREQSDPLAGKLS